MNHADLVKERYMNEIALGPCHPRSILGEICSLNCKYKTRCWAWKERNG